MLSPRSMHLVIDQPQHLLRLSLDYFVELRRGFAIKQWSHTLARLIVRRTAMHRQERGLIFKFNYSRVVSSFHRLEKLSTDETLKIRECLV